MDQTPEMKECETYWTKLFICGDIQTIKDEVRRYCYYSEMCVAVEATEYIYKGGAEQGATITFNNYPRFPTTAYHIKNNAIILGNRLMRVCAQTSFMVQSKDCTQWYTRRKNDKSPIEE